MNIESRDYNERYVPSVLVVDDDVDALAEVCEMVDALGFSVRGVDTVRSALAVVAEDKSIGLVITDLKLNLLDGFDLIDELQARYGAKRQIAKIVLSGFPTFENALTSLRLGVVDFIEKPATFEKLKTAIRQALVKRNVWRADLEIGAEMVEPERVSTHSSADRGSALEFVKSLQRQRARRSDIADSSLFSDPAWDILLDLVAARLGGHVVSVSSACAAAQVPFSTALRYVNRLVKEGWAIRESDPNDRRRDLLALSDRGFERMEQYINSVLGGRSGSMHS